MKTSVASVTFRRKSVCEVAELARRAGLDAIETEPIAMDNPLLSAKNCVITPHISWAALECRRRLQQTAIENVRAYLAGACINMVC